MDRSGSVDSGRAGANAGWLLALAVLGALLGLKLWRAGMESSLWMDEVWSLGLATHPWRDLLEFARLDVNPPLYYLALRGWLGLLDAVGIPASVVAARSLNLVVWVLLATSAATIGSRLVGARRAWIPALLVAGSASALQFTQDARPYGFALIGSATCFLLVAVDLERRRRGDEDGFWGLWLVYAVSAFVALGSHVLCLPLVGLIGIAWIVLAGRQRQLPRRWQWLPPISAHLVAVAAALPWLLVGLRSGRALEAGDPGWLTPATLPNLIQVFTEWIPLGRAGAEVGALSPLMRVLGLLSFLSVLAIPILLRADARRRATGDRTGDAVDLFVAGVLVAAVHVLLIWSAQRLGWLHIFYGPRYACLSVGVWTGAIALGVAAVGRRRGRSAALLLAAPWVVAGLLSTLLAARAEAGAGLAGQSARIRARSASAPIFFAPRRLAPFFRETLDKLGAEPSRQLPCALLHGGDASLLLLNAWPQNDPPEEILFRSAVAQGRVTRASHEFLPPSTRDFELWRLERAGSDRDLLEQWCARGISVRSPPLPVLTLAVALPERQLRSAGWSYLEFDRDLFPFRWTASATARLDFDRSLEPGRYRLRLRGYRAPGSGGDGTLVLANPDGSWSRTIALGSGEFDRVVELVLDDRPRNPLALVLRHPLWEPAAAPNAGDARRLGISLRSAIVQAPAAASDARPKPP